MKVRNMTLRKKILIRDLGICACCGFEGNEVHHITPLVYGGEDKEENMITLCSLCHKHSPDKKEEFYKYLKSGGAKTHLLFGRLIQDSFNGDIEGLTPQECLIAGRSFIRTFRKTAYIMAYEKYMHRWEEIMELKAPDIIPKDAK